MHSGTIEKDWHTRTSSEVAASLDVDLSLGLTAAGVSARQEKFGANLLQDEAKAPVWKKVLRRRSGKKFYGYWQTK